METNQSNRFDDIRPFHDSEIPSAIDRLISDIHFRKATESFIQPFTWEQLIATMKKCTTTHDLQQQIIDPLLQQLIRKTTSETNGLGWENIQDGRSHVFISNHRDIVLDAAFLNILIFNKGMNTTEIAIGDNLLIYPWITTVVRLNKSFIVKRGVSVRQILEVSKHLSDYIHDTIGNRGRSVWIAQREGRAKDSDDKTQTSLLKMLTLHNSANPLEALKKLHIIPLAISYEFDPCDYLKAKEFQLKRDDPDHKKSHADDIENMLTGITGFKGRVNFKFGELINDKLENISSITERSTILKVVADIIDKEIYRNYTFFPFNYAAYDLMMGTRTFASEYTETDRDHFEKYIRKQIDKIELENKDFDFLRERIIEMYGNPVRNYVKTR